MEMKVGQLANPKDTFCPFAAVTKWPYRHLYGEESDLVSGKYFAHGKFRSRGWTIFYIHTLLDFHEGKPLLLVPSKEVQALFTDINNNLGIYRGFPNIIRYPGFEVGFQDGPRPRYLGRLTEDCSLTELEEMIPDSFGEELQEVEDRSFPAFRQKMEAAILAGKNKQKIARDKRKKDRVVTKRGWCAQLRRAQCYLGVRPRGTVNKEDFHGDPNHTYEQSQAAQEAYEKAAGIKLPPLNPNSRGPYPFDQSVVFVCVDVEAYEKDHKKITEVGISTLDTLDLAKSPPGEGGVEWMKMIRGRHFRIAEHGHLTNTEFVIGCADNLEEKFGTSEWISITEAPQVIASCFRYPFSEPGQYYPYPSDPNTVGRNGCGSHYLPPIDESQPKRNIVLVGHNINADVDYLRNIGYDVTNLSNLLEAIDTADMFRAMKYEQNPRNLGAVLNELELVGWHLHNAGNDAGYTLEALIGISFAALNVTHKPTPDLKHFNAAAAEAQARLIEEVEEWEIADEEGGDGGEPVKLPGYQQMMENRSFDQGLQRAQKVEDKQARKRAKDKVRGGRGGGRGYNYYRSDDFPPLRPSVERKGETNYHTANEQKMRDMNLSEDVLFSGSSATSPHPRSGSKSSSKTREMTKPDKKIMERLADLDDDEYFTI